MAEVKIVKALELWKYDGLFILSVTGIMSCLYNLSLILDSEYYVGFAWLSNKAVL